MVLGRCYSKHQLVFTKVLSCCDINIWPVLQFWYWSGRFFYIIINIVDWYHAFTYISVSNKQNDTNVRPEWNFQPSEFEKEEMSIGKRREEKRINGIFKGKIGRSKFYATGIHKEVAREVLWNFLELRYGSAGLQKNHRCCPATMSCSSSQM